MPRKAGLNVATVARLLLCLTVMVIASVVSVVSTALAQEKPATPAESMAKLIVIYRIPRDPAEFDRYYAQVHTPLAKKIPGLRRLEVTRLTGAPSGASDLYLIAELYFDNAAAREAALASNEAKATEADLSKFAEGIVSVYFGVGREP
jgi:uncharacterized protein (TIGR02118 family)